MFFFITKVTVFNCFGLAAPYSQRVTEGDLLNRSIDYNRVYGAAPGFTQVC